MQAIKIAMEQIEKQFGKGSIMKLGDKTDKMTVDVIPTGSIAIDLALGVGGFPPRSRHRNLRSRSFRQNHYCPALYCRSPKIGGQAAFIDAEHALDPARAEAIGVKLNDLYISQPDTGEQALEIVETLIRSGALDVIVIDSVAALVPRAEIEGEMGDAMMGVQARLMSQALRKITGAISKSHTVVIFINQLRMKIGVMFGNPETTTGGMALKFYSSVRVDTRKIETLKDGDKVIGSRHRARIVKNKVASPFSVAEFDILNEGGISKSGGLMDVGLELGVLTKKGAFIYHGDAILGQGREAVRIYLNENPKSAKQIEDAIWKAAHDSKKPSPNKWEKLKKNKSALNSGLQLLSRRPYSKRSL